MRYSAPTLAERPGLRFLILLTVWGLMLTAVVTNASVMASVVVPFSRWQGAVAAWYLAVPSLPVSVVPSCSGLDAMSLCVAAIFAFPRTWRDRLAGASAGLLLLLIVNLARIASLAVAADSPWFDVLHIVVWPAVLIATTAGWVYLWIRVTAPTGQPRLQGPINTRAVTWTAVSLGVYVVLVPVLGSLQVLDMFARDLASLAVSVLTTFGVAAEVRGNLLVAGSSPYLVTSDCVTTPLMALYVAAVMSAPIGVRARLLWALAFAPIFVTLAVIRLLTVAVPPMFFGSPLFVTHAFHQIVLALLVVAAAAMRWRPERRAVALAGIVAASVSLGVIVALVLGPVYSRAIIDGLTWMGVQSAAAMASPAVTDLQGALTSLPAFQIALFVALAFVVWHHLPAERLVAGVTALIVVQGLTMAVVAAIGLDPSTNVAALMLRAWAIVVPGVVVIAMLRPRAERAL